MPLDFMLRMMRDETADNEDRKWAAQQSAPYCHAKLSSIEVGGNKDSPLTVVIDPRIASLTGAAVRVEAAARIEAKPVLGFWSSPHMP